VNSLFVSDGPLAGPIRETLVALRDPARASIVLATVDDPYAPPHDALRLRDEAMWALAASLFGKYSLHELNCAVATIDSIPRYCRRLSDRPACLFVYNMEAVRDEAANRYDVLLSSLNRHREDIRDTGTALVPWLTPAGRDDVLTRAPDFADWRSASVLFTVQRGVDVPQVAPVGVSLAEADDMRRQRESLAAMLAKPGLEPALCGEFRRRLAEIEAVVGDAAVVNGHNGIATAGDKGRGNGAGPPRATESARRVRRAYMEYVAEECRNITPRGVSQTVRSVTLPLEEVYVSMTTEHETREDVAPPGMRGPDGADLAQLAEYRRALMPAPRVRNVGLAHAVSGIAIASGSPTGRDRGAYRRAIRARRARSPHGRCDARSDRPAFDGGGFCTPWCPR
jgi:hypothetical protein